MKKQMILLALSLLTALHLQAGPYEQYYQQLPIQMSEPVLPTQPSNTVKLTDFGGVGDGLTDNTEAFRKAISTLQKQGGGRLIVPQGVYLTGMIVLKSNIDLHVERNAMIQFSPDKQLFLKRDKTTGQVTGEKAQPGINASKCQNISITGQGIIDGNGEWWRAVKRSKVSDVEWKSFREMGGTVTDDGSLWYPFNLKHFSNIADDYKRQESMRVHMIRLTDCENVLVKDVTLQNAPKFHLVPQRCKNVTIDGVNVRCPWNAQNGDGIDIMQCRDVLIVNSRVDVGDDGICLKGGVGADGVKHGGCENLLIQDNIVFHAHGGFVIGSEFSGGMHNIVVRGNTFSGTDTGLRFKSGAGRGGKTGRIFISDIFMNDIKDEAITFETTYADNPVGTSGRKATGEEFLPEFCDIDISRVVCRDCKTAVSAHGTIEMIHDIRLKDCTFFYTKKAYDIDAEAMFQTQNVKMATF